MTLDIQAFDPGLARVLGLEELPFSREPSLSRPFNQVGYIDRHLRWNKAQPCKSVAIEAAYIDRDHMEDHGVFYSRSFYPYSGRCKRAHFFSLPPRELQQFRDRIHASMASVDRDEYTRLCKDLSDNHYLGFMVLKPLRGCPVGRTVLRCYPPRDGAELRNYSATRTYHVHVEGIDLTVDGLAFQQQDTGVSACATTALWTSLQNQSKFEEIPVATPAQITLRATAYGLPFGRAMPSEGLSLDQMCIAVQSFGLAPNLTKLSSSNNAIATLHTALVSQYAPVLILERNGICHAVTVVGMRTLPGRAAKRRAPLGYCELASDMVALYVHDDRNGPYMRANLRRRGDDKPLGIGIELRMGSRKPGPEQPWRATHVLVPMHPKIRLSLHSLQALARRLCFVILDLVQLRAMVRVPPHLPPIQVRTWIERSHKYLQSLAFDEDGEGGDWIVSLVREADLPRYAGIIELARSDFGRIHVLVDTTSTRLNPRILGIVIVELAARASTLVRDELMRACAGSRKWKSYPEERRVRWVPQDGEDERMEIS